VFPAVEPSHKNAIFANIVFCAEIAYFQHKTGFNGKSAYFRPKTIKMPWLFGAIIEPVS
jgi:hypothetical protein